jgi:hypothetical protein
LIQSAFDGYNVCICAYGQTGSGKTHTIIGGDADPGLAPRTFHRIFELANEYSTQFHVHVSIYMLELYNDKLIDLLRQGAEVISIFTFQNCPKMDLFLSGETGHQERQTRRRLGARQPGLCRGECGPAQRFVQSGTQLASQFGHADERSLLPLPSHRRHQHRMCQPVTRHRRPRQGTASIKRSAQLGKSKFRRCSR